MLLFPGLFIAIKDTVKGFVKDFDRLTGTEKRNFIEKIIKKIIVKDNNELEIVIYGEPPSVVRRNRISYQEVNGVDI